LHVLVYERVLHDDVEFQLAHAHRIVQVPDLRWSSNSDTDSHANTYADTNSDTDTNSDAYSDTNACAVAGRTHESGWECSLCDSDQFVVDG
jgi:hypothetical protein